MQEVHRKRIEVAINVWGEILEKTFENREQLVSYLEAVYRENKLEPIRGKTRINIYDKELATLYLVGKYGLALEDEISSFSDLFHVEIKADKVLSRVLSGEDPRNAVVSEFGSTEEDNVFRVLRLAMTAVVLGFMDEETFIRVLESFEKAFPELDRNFTSFKRFYIAFRLAEKIAAGEIRNRLEKEAYKHALCVKLNAEKAAPPDSFIRDIAVNALKVPEFKVNSALSLHAHERSS